MMCNNTSSNFRGGNIPEIEEFYADTQRVRITPEDSIKIIELKGSLNKIKIENEEKRLKEYEKNEIIISYFAGAFAKLLKHPIARKIIKQEIDKRFDDEEEFLWKTIAEKTVENCRISEIVRDRIGSPLISEEDFNSISLLNIYLHNAEKWDGITLPKVAWSPIMMDDIKVKKIKAWDSNLHIYELDACNPPEEPVFVIGLNERVEPKSGLLKKHIVSNNNISKTAENKTLLLANLSWYYVKDNQEPWFKGDAEIEFGFICLSGGPHYCRIVNVKDATWQNLQVPAVSSQGVTPAYYSVVMYEDDLSLDDAFPEYVLLECQSDKYLFKFAYHPIYDDDDDIIISENNNFGGPDITYCYSSPPSYYHELNGRMVKTTVRVTYCPYYYN